jgi:hypothetical protein
MKIQFSYEQNDCPVVREFSTLEGLQGFVKGYIAHDLTKVPLELVVDGMVCDLPEYISKVRAQGSPETPLPATTLTWDDYQRRNVDQELN